ncbi:MAG: FAD-binding oxidoreductase [bacterium]
MIKDYKAKLTKKVWVSESVMKLNFDLQEPTEIEFEAGQFINVILPNKVARAYSIAPSPHIKNSFELVIGYYEGGKASEYFKSLNEGEDILFKCPFGRFTYANENVENVVMIGTGTGIAPVKSVIDKLNEDKVNGTIQSLPKIYVYEGFRFLKDVVYEEEFNNYAKNGLINYELWLSREDSPEFKGNKGRVTLGLDKLTLDWQSTSIYICGNKEIVLSLKEYFMKKGVLEDKIHFERFN